jgi:heme oxygenase (mycobilin-producing)
MSIVKINVLQVPEGRGEVLEQRFAARAGEVEKVDGFESFELLRPTEGTDRYLVVTRWRDEAAFRSWLTSDAFGRGHAQSQADRTAEESSGAGHPGGHGAQAHVAAEGDHDEGRPGSQTAHPHGAGHPHGGGHGAHDEAGTPAGGGHPGSGQGGGPAAVGSELWGFEIITSATAASD